MLSDQLSNCPSHLFQHSAVEWLELIPKRGKRLLSALKTASALLYWTQCGDVNILAEKFDSYPYDLVRLCESIDRILLAASAIQDLIDPTTEIDWLRETPGPKSSSSINVLRQMILHGVTEQSAALTFILGIGPKWLRKLMNGGIKNLPDLAVRSPDQLQQLRGLSKNRAENWINAAQDLLDSDFPPNTSPPAPFFRAKPQALDLQFDPYRLRRALELSVQPQKPNSWTVTGGLEPHTVSIKQESSSFQCDCRDHAQGHTCKHILAIGMYRNDPQIHAAADRLGQLSDDQHIDLFTLWVDHTQ